MSHEWLLASIYLVKTFEVSSILQAPCTYSYWTWILYLAKQEIQKQTIS